MDRAKAFETDDGALRCYLDQLPTDRCIFCARATPARNLHVAGPVHRWTNVHEMADSDSVGDRVAAAAALLSRRPGAITAKSQQTRGLVWMTACLKCVPTPRVPLLVGIGLGLATVGLGVLGSILGAVLAGLAAVVAFVIAGKRSKLSVGEIDEDDFMFKIHRVDDGVKTEVIALGAAPHPASRATGQFRA